MHSNKKKKFLSEKQSRDEIKVNKKLTQNSKIHATIFFNDAYHHAGHRTRFPKPRSQGSRGLLVQI